MRLTLIFICLFYFQTMAVRAQQSEFVRVENGQFRIGQASYHFVGANLWYAMNLGAGTESDRARLVRELDRLQALGVLNLRIMAASEGAPMDKRLSPTVQPKPGKYDKTMLKGLDFVLTEMGKRNMRAVLTLNNFFQWSGGMSQYVSWATGTEIPFPEQNGHTWDDYQRYAAQFYSNKKAIKWNKKYLKTLLKRKNSISRICYKKDPVIMAWQLCNEPREYGQVEPYVKWVSKTAHFIQKKAKRQLVSIGSEGMLSEQSGTAYARLAENPDIDYLTAHLWVENWNWYDPTRAAATFDSAQIKAEAYIEKHIALADKVDKPLVLEEFGIGRENGSFLPGDSTTSRDKYYAGILGQIFQAAETGRNAGGVNFWAWAGEVQPPEPAGWWKPGDPFTGDPPHEKQGWYSVYASDVETSEVIRAFAEKMKHIFIPLIPKKDQF